VSSVSRSSPESGREVSVPASSSEPPAGLSEQAARAAAAACAAAGLAYVAIPIDHTGFSLEQVTAMAEAMNNGPVLAYCRSGTRSCNLWALAAARQGEAPDAIIAAAQAGGYNVAGLLPLFRQLAGSP
jgi:uncharacterized protein (TIGR01244 family)